MRKNKYIMLYFTAVFLTFALFAASSAMATDPPECSTNSCDSQNPYNISVFYEFLKNEKCGFFRPGDAFTDIEDICKIVAVDDFETVFTGKKMQITAIAREAAYRVTVAPETYPGDILFDSDLCYNWGRWIDFDFSDDLLFTDLGTSPGDSVRNFWTFPRNNGSGLPFQVCRLKQGTYLLEYLDNPIELKPGDYVIGINDTGGGTADYDDFILVARESFFTFSVPTAVPVWTKDGYGFLTNCFTESGYCEVILCSAPGGEFETCKGNRIPIENFLSTKNQSEKATLIEVPGKRGGIVIDDSSSSSPSYCSGGWCWYW